MLLKSRLVTALSRPERAPEGGFYVWKDLVLGDQWQPDFKDELELLQQQVTNKRGHPEEDRALRLDGRESMVYWGDAKHEQASSLSHERVAPPPKGQKKRKN